ncbi:hypothetical protein [Spirosoma endophyticum]|uniref:Uncharacterized protein n=1 Tax=Spirosoma endophyticum TaxID=662367 RepID=A0A1I1H726_9BACT|nr:hypothetical protein [Spirosoma endophyticum]SFC19807.1 hypothetical protein SAMN05216167_101641 [Spirosoma endophyticum]
MALNERAEDPDEEPMVTTADDDTEGTAPDADTQSSAASEAGNRTAKGGSRAPNDPAEGE